MTTRTYVKVEGGAVTQRTIFNGTMPLSWSERGAWRESEDAQIGWIEEGGQLVPPPPPPALPPEPADVDGERERRISLGFTAQTSTGKAIPIDTRSDRDFRNLNGLGTAAGVYMRKGMPGHPNAFTFTGADNQPYTLNPLEMEEVALQALAHVDRHYKAARQLKSSSPIPDNFRDDSFWA